VIWWPSEQAMPKSIVELLRRIAVASCLADGDMDYIIEILGAVKGVRFRGADRQLPTCTLVAAGASYIPLYGLQRRTTRK
jgi:hypothetical protein